MTLWRHFWHGILTLLGKLHISQQLLEIDPDPYSPHMSRVLPFDSACDSDSNDVVYIAVRTSDLEKIAKHF